jgi:hypothetical protein
MSDTSVHRYEKRVSHGDHAIALMGRSLLFVGIILGSSGCASPQSMEMSSYDSVHDQQAIAGYYRNQAIVMREKANAQITAAARYEGLFGPDDDLVSGARLLADYYEQTAKELERVAEAHAAVDRTGQRPPIVP